MRAVLLADIGGTHARFAVLRGDDLEPILSLDVRSHATMADALRSFLVGRADSTPIEAAILAVAGPVENGRCELTNSAWIADASELSQEFGIHSVRIINDQEASAWGLLYFGPSDTCLIGPDTPAAGAPLALLSPGTGLGVACLVAGPPGARVIASEGGHATLAATTAHEEALIGVLRGQFGHVSAERVLSGGGLVNLYRATATIDGCVIVPRTAAEITRAGLDGSCSMCRRVLDTFCALLGAVAGDIALHFGARGGVYIGGGIVPKIVDHLPVTEFRVRFEGKGRFEHYLAGIPVRVIVRANPAFLGLAALARSDKPCSHV